MTIDELVDVLNDKDVSIHWDGMCYSLRLRNIPAGFFNDYLKIESLNSADILDDNETTEAVLKLAKKYKGGD